MEQVLFRHADPAVMRALLPILDPRQRARVWGGAKAIVVDLGPAGGGLRRATVPPDMPPRAPGMLRLTPGQMAALEAAIQGTRERQEALMPREELAALPLEGFPERMARIMRARHPDALAATADEDLAERLADAAASARRYAIWAPAPREDFLTIAAVSMPGFWRHPTLAWLLDAPGASDAVRMGDVRAVLQVAHRRGQGQ